ncbi:ABC transporter ATP-binding protein [Virgibacillus halodenitrificans]|uniref:ABC transporter ATP-binding protein n=1 Tax=Virgibacillus halodenitrificans TaxID=1482 RepID=UPI000761C9CF|nr:ABC transporter ATP-binding protein [Virgibacillus halodenitrificans]MCG1027228.1 ABC transporter ATP-binding protein [Virgibacillus halodenitrificans]MYL57363.1 ATP-binding cassette domain-containing protein [Virgibacillus halodenitrificans]
MSLLKVNNLKVNFKTYGGTIRAVRNVSFEVDYGETVAIVGESGSGKSVTVQAIMGLIKKPAGEIEKGNILFKGKELLQLSQKQLREIKGKQISMVFQDSMTSLNPTMKVGKQISEVLLYHQHVSKQEAKARAIEMIKEVGIPNAERRYEQYPHEFSGGMRQRIMIAIALACNPDLLIADEPTTALDVTIQAQVLGLLEGIKENKNTSIILITHDLGVVAESADKVIVMYGGMMVEKCSVQELFSNPNHPYTWGLLESIPNVSNKDKERLKPIEGSPPDLFSPPKGCPFAPRCKYAMDICMEEVPRLYDVADGHSSRCFLNDEMAPNIATFSEVEERV